MWRRLPAWVVRVGCTVLTAVAALWLYVSTAVPSIIVWGGIGQDSAELQRMANRLGIAHATGYPIHTLLGYLAARLGEMLGGDPYSWITYSSALCGALALSLFFQIGLELSGPPAALAATILVMVSDIFWHMCTITEVQGLQAIGLIGLIWMMIAHLRRPDRFWPLGGMALCVGLGLANHRIIVLALPSAGLAVLFSGVWRRLTLRQWGTLVGLMVLPLLAYVYIFLRAADPSTITSTHPTGELSGFTFSTVVTHIQGEGLAGNFVWPISDFGERLDYLWRVTASQLGTLGTLAGLLGLGVLSIRRWQIGAVLVLYVLVHGLFLMGWRLDQKAEIYSYALTIPLGIGLLALAAWPVESPLRLRSWWRSRVALAVFSVPLFILAVGLYTANRPNRDLSSVTIGRDLLAQMARVPPDTILYTNRWDNEVFLILEYADISGKAYRPRHEPPKRIIATARNGSRVYLPIWIVTYPNYPLNRDRQAIRNGLAFSGTMTDFFIQVRPQLDAALKTEANQALPVHDRIAPGIELYSIRIDPARDGLWATIYWLAVGEHRADFASFAHLRQYGPGGEFLSLLSQRDWPLPVAGLYPPSLWPKGELVKDTYHIPWPSDPLPVSGVTLTVGLYSPDTGQRAGEYSIPLQGLDAYPINFQSWGVQVRDSPIP